MSLTIDLAQAGTISELHKMFKLQLNFPDWYGMNWDAFWDTITGVIELHSDLKLENFEQFQLQHKRDAEILKRLANNYNKEELDYKIVLL